MIRIGIISGSYRTKGGETAWLVDWADRRKTPPTYVFAAGDFEIGQRVILENGVLRRESERRPAWVR